MPRALTTRVNDTEPAILNAVVFVFRAHSDEAYRALELKLKELLAQAKKEAKAVRTSTQNKDLLRLSSELRPTTYGMLLVTGA